MAANTLDFVSSVEKAVQVGDVASANGQFLVSVKNFRREQSGEILLQVVTHSKKCSVYFIDKDSAEARWVGLGEQSVKHSSRVLQLLKFLFVILALFLMLGLVLSHPICARVCTLCLWYWVGNPQRVTGNVTSLGERHWQRHD